MDLKAQTDAELLSLRDKLNVWCLQHQVSQWGRRLWILIVILGVFAFLTGIIDIFFRWHKSTERFFDCVRSYYLFFLVQKRQTEKSKYKFSC